MTQHRRISRSGTRQKRALGVQAILEWAFRVEKARLELPPPKHAEEESSGFGMEYVLIQRAQLGCQIDGGRYKMGSYDCLGLLRGVWRDVVGPEPMLVPPYSRDWGEAGPVEVLAEAARAAMVELKTSQARTGDVILFRMRAGAIAKHVGILSGSNTFIHAYERTGVIEEHMTPAWQRRIAYAFRFPDPARRKNC